jgi:hypothetical protein
MINQRVPGAPLSLAAQAHARLKAKKPKPTRGLKLKPPRISKNTKAGKAHRVVKLKSVNWWKKKAWSVFSKWVRVRDNWTCITCGKQEQGPGMHGGHFIPGRHNAVLFHEKNVHAQCYWCNMRLKGNPIKYFRAMQQRYGDEVIAQLEALDKTEKQFTREELQAIIEKYKVETQNPRVTASG